MNFKELNLNSSLLEAISYLGFETATPIQEKVIPVIFENRDLIACAQTGTGKTAAYVLPILDRLSSRLERNTNTLIIVPTRELAIQIDQQIQGLSYFIAVGSAAVYGGGDGKDWEAQKEALKNGADIIVATPGKLLSHLNMGYVNFDHIQHLVLDEADRMLDMGFYEDIRTIISYLPKKRQTLMFSATMPHDIRKLAKTVLVDPVEISLSLSKPAEGVSQKAFLVHNHMKIELIKTLLNERKNCDSILIFTATKSMVSEIVRALIRNGFKAEGISSNLEQFQREDVLSRFAARQIPVLVATDVMSRGIDIKEINIVINYDVPHDAEDYVHRVGRTARINNKGEAITLVTPKEIFKLKEIEKLIGNTIPKPDNPLKSDNQPKWSIHQQKSKKY